MNFGYIKKHHVFHQFLNCDLKEFGNFILKAHNCDTFLHNVLI